MLDRTHYETLGVATNATQAQIKQAYRQLAKRFHPDCGSGDRDKIISLNAAYEVLGDPQARRTYDLERVSSLSASATKRYARAASSQNCARASRRQSRKGEATPQRWFQEVYDPVQGAIAQILGPLKRELDALAADPFDDLLMESFLAYLEGARDRLDRAKKTLTSCPNPVDAAGAAAHLYYCLDRLGDGLDEFEWFANNYDEQRLYDGREMFRIARSLQQDAQQAAARVVS